MFVFVVRGFNKLIPRTILGVPLKMDYSCHLFSSHGQKFLSAETCSYKLTHVLKMNVSSTI